MTTGADHREWALLGAKARLAEMEQERLRIFAAFPELGPGSRSVAGSSTEPSQPGRRRMSAEARRQASERMKAYWAKKGKGRRRMSASARRKMSEGMKRHWAERRAKQQAKSA